MVVTYVVLFLLLDSVLLPLKAIVMNLLSITASYGALVWIFQDGHLATWLDFTPGPIQTATPLIMFCLVFGLSMDYEVLLLSRVREEYERSGDNAASVVLGLERTGRLITGAAAIMAAVFFGFGMARSVDRPGCRCRDRRRGRRRRDDRSRAAGAGDDATDGPVELVATGLARAPLARGTRAASSRTEASLATNVGEVPLVIARCVSDTLPRGVSAAINFTACVHSRRM